MTQIHPIPQSMNFANGGPLNRRFRVVASDAWNGKEKGKAEVHARRTEAQLPIGLELVFFSSTEDFRLEQPWRFPIKAMGVFMEVIHDNRWDR